MKSIQRACPQCRKTVLLMLMESKKQYKGVCKHCMTLIKEEAK